MVPYPLSANKEGRHEWYAPHIERGPETVPLVQPLPLNLV